MTLRATPCLFALSLVLAPACGPEEAREAVIEAVRYPCHGLTLGLCLRFTEDGGEPESSFGFENFTHRWGVETRVRFHVERVENPPADGSSQRWIVDEIVDEIVDDVGTQYSISFPETTPDQGLFVASGERLSMSGTEVACAPALCAAVLDRAAAGAPFAATFELTADEAVPLRLLALEDR